MNTVLRRRILSLPRSYARPYTTNNTLSESPAPKRVTPRQNPPHPPIQPQTRHEARVAPRRSPSHLPTQPQTRHEAQEGTTALNVPFNPPGGGPGGNIPGGGGGAFSFTKSPILDAILTTALGLGAVFIGGVAYVKWYKINVLNKMEKAFAAGYDPSLELAKPHFPQRSDSNGETVGGDAYDLVGWTEHLRRKEQDTVDLIIHGKEYGHYFLLLGPKGSGKGTMILDSMAACQAEGVAMCDAHPDLEVFRLRLGKALNFEYNEDTQTGLFQRRDPREGGPALDIERAMNKLEKVALRSAPKRGRPLLLVINNTHFFQNDEAGRSMLLQLQQKAEAWAASGILTLVFTTDDFWPFQFLRKTASRMHVISVSDLDTREALHAATRIRRSAGRAPAEPEDLKTVVSLVGGRLSYLNKTSRSQDMISMANHLVQVEKAWLLSQIGLIPDCDDDVMDEQKWSSCSWLLLQEFVKIRKEQVAALESEKTEEELPLPSIPYWRCRQIMTRPDFMEDLDRANIISIDINHDVRPDSNLILHAAQAVTEEEGFDDLLQGVRDRVDEIESLHRTRELTFKDLGKGDRIRLYVDKCGDD